MTKHLTNQDYHPDDVKGKGEPAFSIERRLKASHNGQDPINDDGTYIELVERPRKSSHQYYGTATGADAEASAASSSARDGGYVEWERTGGVGRSGSVTKRLSVDLKRRIGSLRRRGGGEGVE